MVGAENRRSNCTQMDKHKAEINSIEQLESVLLIAEDWSFASWQRRARIAVARKGSLV